MVRQRVKKVLCPVCGAGRIMDVPAASDARWTLFRADSHGRSEPQAELYLKCPVCKKQIGLTLRQS